jgi:hypothetical protein
MMRRTIAIFLCLAPCWISTPSQSAEISSGLGLFDMVNMGFEALRWLWRDFLLGAAIVIPIWLITRLLKVLLAMVPMKVGRGSPLWMNRKIERWMQKLIDEYNRSVANYSLCATPMQATQEGTTIMTKAPSNSTSSDQAIRVNPLEWKPEHRAGLVVASAAGAALGVAVGYATTHWRTQFFREWLARDPAGALMWAVVGALVVGAAVYCHRVFSVKGR